MIIFLTLLIFVLKWVRLILLNMNTDRLHLDESCLFTHRRDNIKIVIGQMLKEELMKKQ